MGVYVHESKYGCVYIYIYMNVYMKICVCVSMCIYKNKCIYTTYLYRFACMI